MTSFCINHEKKEFLCSLSENVVHGDYGKRYNAVLLDLANLKPKGFLYLNPSSACIILILNFFFFTREIMLISVVFRLPAVEEGLSSMHYSPLSKTIAVVQTDPSDNTDVIDFFNQVDPELGFFATFFPRESRTSSPACGKDPLGEGRRPRSASNQFLGSPRSLMPR